jgi:hypothetical protein
VTALAALISPLAKVRYPSKQSSTSNCTAVLRITRGAIECLASQFRALGLEANLSVYFSPYSICSGRPSRCTLSESCSAGIAAAQRWEWVGARIFIEEMQRQVRADGSHFEQSSYYHVYALDMFLFHVILVPSEEYRRSLERMALCLDALMVPAVCFRLSGITMVPASFIRKARRAFRFRVPGPNRAKECARKFYAARWHRNRSEFPRHEISRRASGYMSGPAWQP